jgi:hypothetical protein
MELKEYIEQAKKELDKMEEAWLDNNTLSSVNWPLVMSKEEWVEQELAVRFGQ